MDSNQIKALNLSDSDSLTIDSSFGPQADTTMLSSGYAADSITISSNTYGAIPPTGGIYTIKSTVGLGTPPVTINQSGTIDLQGENADIKVNGESMMETLRGIQDRLNMLRPNPELEEEWDQLRELGDQYRKLEAEFKEKSKMWNTLKK